MNNLLFTALLIALLYYFCYYLPQQKKLNNANLPLQHDKGIQTETMVKNEEPGPVPNPQELESLKKDIQQKEKTITNLNNSYQKLETKSQTEIDDLKKQIKTITHQLTQLQTHQNQEQKDLASTLDNLLKNIQDFNQEL